MHIRPIAAALALFAAAGASQATITTVSSAATFQTLTGAAVDTFADQTINTDLGLSSLLRSGYSVSTQTGLYVVPAAGTVALSTNLFSDTLTLGSFTSPLLAVGANFFGSNVLGELASGGLTVTATDANGLTKTATLAGNSLSGFVGFLSDVPLVSVVVGMTSPNTNVYASLDNVAISAVPEPGTWLMLLAGGAVMLRGAARRRA